jgi:hypothetical protein
MQYNQNLPEDQCIFIRGFRATRRLGLLPSRLRGAAGPAPTPDEDGPESDMQLLSIPADTNVTSFILSIETLFDVLKVSGPPSHAPGIYRYSG